MEQINADTTETTDITSSPLTPVGEFEIAVRPHRPAAYNLFPQNMKETLDKQFAWVYNTSHVVTKETAESLAKSGHNTCGGKGWLEYSRVPIGPYKNQYIDQIVFCDCAIRNGGKIRV